MSTQVLTNLRKRLLCTLEASDVFILARGNSATEASTAESDLKAALALAPYESAAQRRLQTLRLLRGLAAEQDRNEAAPLGVVVEFGVESGTDALAAFSDGVAAWFDATSSTLTEATLQNDGRQVCQSLMAASVRIREVTGAPTGDTPPPPPTGFACISLITESGISYGMGPMRDLASDGYGGPIIHWALNLREVILAARMSSLSST
jgi:hypothetical protein